MSSSAATDVSEIIEELSPEKILIINIRDTESPFHISCDCEITVVHEGDILAAIESAGTQDLAIIVNTLENIEKKLGANILARLRDVYSKRLLTVVPVKTDANQSKLKSTWHETDFIAYGMRQITTYSDGKHLYEYNILNYKSIPDWLNAKNWANPELWDKFRW